MILKGYGIILKRLTEDKIELVRHWRNHPKIQQYMEYKEYITEAMQRDWFNHINNDSNYYFVIQYKEKEIGLINIKDIDFTRWDSGTGVPSMTASTLYNLPMIKPNIDLLKRFDKAITPIFYKMKQIRVEYEVLTKQRDELLPLLMNGQVSIPNCD